MTKEVLEKFYFNMNVFDDDYVEELEPEEDLPPPPPTFSEAELETAKRAAFEEGKQAGIEETKQSRDTLVAKAIAKIAQETPQLFLAEGQREKRYEQEALSLALEIFKKLYPLYSERVGFEELRETVTAIMASQQGQKQIAVYVEPAATEGIEKMLADLTAAGTEMNFKVIADENLANGACRLTWQDGGAVSNPEKLAHEIRDSIEQVLAASGATRHDSEEELDPVPETTEEAQQQTDETTGEQDAEPPAEPQEPEKEVQDEQAGENVAVEDIAEETEIEGSETMEKPDE